MVLELLLAAAALQDRPRDPDPICQAEVRWAVEEPRVISRSATPRSVSLFTAVGQALSGSCRPVDISLTAAYFDGSGDLLCSGVVPGIATHAASAVTQVTDLELRPGSLIEFVRWRNAGRNLRRTVALVCTSSDGITEVQPDELLQARSLRLWASVATRYTGLATDELVITLAP